MTGARLQLKDLTKVYGKPPAQVTALEGASLTVEPGEIVLVMGPSGAGKTTMLAMCGGLMHPTSGSVWLDDVDISALGERQLPLVRLRKIGFVFQTFNLLANLTALENVALVLQANGVAARKAVSDASDMLRELHLGQRLDSLPEQLSGGEKQRVALARAMANDPSLILADEPTGSLDSRTGSDVVHLLEHLAKERDKTVVVVTHDQRIVDIADRVLWLEDGHLSEGGPDDAVLVKDPVCGTIIDVRRAAGQRTFGRRVLSFCSERCTRRFDEDPERFVGHHGHEPQPSR